MHIKTMFQSIIYVIACIVLNKVVSQPSRPNDQYEKKIEALANQVEGFVVSEAMRIALAKDAMEETVNEAVESIETELVKLHQIADIIQRNSRDQFCLQAITLINEISLDPLKSCNYSSRFDGLREIVKSAAKLYATLKNVTRFCDSLAVQDNCEDQLLAGIENSVFKLTESVNESVEKISNSYLSCIQEELALTDKTFKEIGLRVQQCV